MKMSRFCSIALLGIALVATPVYAQRGGGGGRSGGGSHSSSSSMSRGGGVSSSRGSSFSSSSSSSRSSFSSSSRSSSPSSSRSSYSGSSMRSGSTFSSSSLRSGVNSSRSYSGTSRSDVSRSTYSGSRSGGFSSSRSSEGVGTRQGGELRSRTGSVPSQVRSRTGMTEGVRSSAGRSGNMGEGAGRVSVGAGRPTGVAPEPTTGYARPGHPGPLPPSHRPIHPAPYFWHPHHHCLVHCHRLYWDPFIPRAYYWPGFWVYCDSYWYDYHVTDVVVVREYVRDTYKLDLITYAFSGDYMYALVNDPDGHTYLQIYNREDKLLAEQRVSRKYCKIEVDPENGGCWIMKKRDKDPLLFFYTEDGQLLIYEAD